MGTIAESTPSDEEKKSRSPLIDVSSSSMVKSKFDGATKSLRSRLTEIGSTYSAHFHQSIDSMQDVELAVYKDMIFGKVKEGINFACSHPWITSGVLIGLLKYRSIRRRRRRYFVYHETLRLLLSEEPLPSRVDPKVKELRETMDLWMAETKKLQRRLALAEEEQLIRERTKLRQAGKEIEGLKDILQESPTTEAFQSQV